MRPTSRSATRTLQVTRWLGTIAAVLGLALFLGTLLLHQGTTNSTSAPNSGQYNGSNPAVAGRTATDGARPVPTHEFANGGTQGTDKAATATASPTIPAQSSGTPATTLANNSPAPTTADILRVVALVLLFGGIVLALVSFVVARRL